jgi:hypothetical protein
METKPRPSSAAKPSSQAVAVAADVDVAAREGARRRGADARRARRQQHRRAAVPEPRERLVPRRRRQVGRELVGRRRERHRTAALRFDELRGDLDAHGAAAEDEDRRRPRERAPRGLDGPEALVP